MSAGDSVDGKRKAEFIPIEVLDAEFKSFGTKLKNELQKAHKRINDLEGELLAKEEDFSRALKQKEDRCNSLSDEMTKQQEENVKLKKEIEQLEKGYSREQSYLMNMNEENKKHIESLNDRIKSMNTEIKELNCEHSTEIEQLKFELNEAKHALTCKFNEDRIRKTEMEYKMQKFEGENVKYCEIVKNLNAEIKTLKSEMEQLQTRNVEYMQMVSEKEQEINNFQEAYKIEREHFVNVIKETDEKIQDLNVEKTYITSECTKKAMMLDIHTENIGHLENRLKASQQMNGKLQNISADQLETITTLGQENKALQEEKSILLLRLSTLHGSTLTYLNPDIADLSDEKRPTKLAEEFSELYDNEWTDAFEEVNIEDEKEKTTFMLQLLKRANELCNELAENHVQSIKKSFSTIIVKSKVLAKRIPEGHLNDKLSFVAQSKPGTSSKKMKLESDYELLSREQKKTILEARKFFEKELSEKIERAGTDFIVQEVGIDAQKQGIVVTYIQKCMDVCWSMCRLEPPVHVDFATVIDDIRFDTNTYKPYTKSGTHVDYLVWPAVYLHKDGPMLAKGMAQGKKK